MKRITLMLGDEDWENLHVALGYAVAACKGPADAELGARAMRRLIALHDALALADVEDVGAP